MCMKLVIFGCGRIANRIAEACKMVEGLDLVGFASKDIDRAKEYCEKYNCREYGDYDHFLDGDVDAVYIATYNKSHYELIRRCLEHHKNVICEKPMLFSIEQNKEMFALARENNVLLMEALKSVFLPINKAVKDLVDDGVIGEVTFAFASFMRNGSHDENHWINDPDCGGALCDLGSYCVGTLNYVLDKEPELIAIESDRTDDKAETTAEAILRYDNIKARIMVSNSMNGENHLVLTGTDGLITVDNFWKTGKGYYDIDELGYELDEEFINDFYYELKHFNDLVDKGIKESEIMSEKASQDILKITSSVNDYGRYLFTKRLILRPWDISDADRLYELASDPEVGPVCGWPPHKSVEESKKIIETIFSKDDVYAICLKNNNEPIGSIQMKFNEDTDIAEGDKECELGFWLGKEYWGNGYMPEAAEALLEYGFEKLELNKIWCAYFDGNEKSKRCQEKIGFRYQWTSYDVDVPQMNEKRTGHVNCMTKEEWRESHDYSK